MNIRIGKTDVASLGCEGCKKKIVCNIANNSEASGMIVGKYTQPLTTITY